jgi:hypothetical protein
MPGSTYADYTNYLLQSRNSNPRATLTLAVEADPTREGKLRQFAREANLPQEVASALETSLDQQFKVDRVDRDTQNTPVLRQSYTDADFAKLAHDDSKPLSALEQLMVVPRGAASAGPAFTSGFYGLLEIGAGAVGATGARDFFGRQRVVAEEATKNIAGSDGGSWFGRTVQGASQSIGQAVPALTAMAIGAPASAVTAAFMIPGIITQAGQSAVEAKEAGKSDTQALLYGAQQGAWEGLLEKLPIDLLLKNIAKGTNVASLFGQQLVAENITESLTTVAQNFTEWANLNPDKPFGDWLKEQPAAVRDTIAQTTLATAGVTGAAVGINNVRVRAEQRRQRAEQAQQNADFIDRLSKVAEASALRSRAPDIFEDLVQRQAEAHGAPEAVYVTPEVFNQVFSTPEGQEALAAMPQTVRDAVSQAAQTGGDVRIPLGEFAAQVAPTPLYAQLQNDIKLDPNGLTRAEAEEFVKTESEKLRADVEKTLGETVLDEAGNVERERVRDELKAQLDKTSRFTSDVNDIYATFAANSIAAVAARSGLTIDEVLAANPLFVNAGDGAVVGTDALVEQDQDRPAPQGESSATDQQQATPDRQRAQAGELRGPAGVRGGPGLLADAPGADTGDDQPLNGLPRRVRVDGRVVNFGPFAPAARAARAVAQKLGRAYTPPVNYAKVDEARAARIAQAFEDMKHDPRDPEVAASYAAMIQETIAQWEEIKATGLKVEFIRGEDPYGNPRNAIIDVVENNHLWVFPTDDGFGEILVNIGLDSPTGGAALTPEQVIQAMEEAGAVVLAHEVHTSQTEPTVVARLARPLTQEQGDSLSDTLGQEAIAQLAVGEGMLFGPMAPQWGPFNADYFLMLDGRFATEAGVFTDNPLLQFVEGEIIDGRPVRANDLFRIVHDYFGHVTHGVGFRADGEENAWRAHSAMYSPLARKAMTTETRGQNSWVNYGPYGEENRTADGLMTKYAPQKIGLLPDWVVNEGATDETPAEQAGVLYQEGVTYDPGLGLRSAVFDYAQEKGPGKASAQQWLATLAKAPGVKAEELEWMGLKEGLELLDEGKGVTKEQVLNYIARNGVRLTEIVNGSDVDYENYYEDEDFQEIESELVEQAWRDSYDAPDYTVARGWPGEDGYLIPEDEIEDARLEAEGRAEELGEPAWYAVNDDDLWQERSFVVGVEGHQDRYAALAEARELLSAHESDARDDWDIPDWVSEQAFDTWSRDHAGGTKWESYTLNGGENYREFLLSMPRWDNPRVTGDYSEAHFDAPNIIAHFRTKDRTDDNGLEHLHFQELQSTLHQEGRSRGYKTTPDPAKIAAAEQAVEDAATGYLEAVTPLLDGLGPDMLAWGKQLGELGAEARAALQEAENAWQAGERRGWQDYADQAREQAIGEAWLAYQDARDAYYAATESEQEDARAGFKAAEARLDAARDKPDPKVEAQSAARERRFMLDQLVQTTTRLQEVLFDVSILTWAVADASSVQSRISKLAAQINSANRIPLDEAQAVLPRAREIAGGETGQRVRDGVAALTDAPAVSSARLALAEAKNALSAVSLPTGIPDFPFKGDAWATVVLKRAIRIAVEEDKQAISWIFGNQQNGATDAKGGWFYNRNLINIANALLKKYGAKVELMPFRGIADGYGGAQRREADLDTINAEFAPKIAEVQARAAAAREIALAVGVDKSNLQGSALAAFYRESVKADRSGELLDALSELKNSEERLAEIAEEKNRALSFGYQWGFRITPELREAVAQDRLTLFQEARGTFTPSSGAISLLRTANLSTFLHEFGHWHLETLARLSAREDAPQQVKEDFDTILRWMGVTGGEQPAGGEQGGALAQSAVGLPRLTEGGKKRPKIVDVARALTADHMAKFGRKLYPERSEEDHALVLGMAEQELAEQLRDVNSGVGWYGEDVELALRLSSRLFPTLANTPAHRELYLTFAAIFSSGETPEKAWVKSSEAFRTFLATGEVPVKRDHPQGKGWSVRNQNNEQLLAFVRYLAQREGSLDGAMSWLAGVRPRVEINAAMLESGLFKEGRYKTKGEQAGPDTYGFLAFGPKLGRYAMGLHGVDIDAGDTTVDLWYTRTFRRWGGRLLDPPLGGEGVAAQPANPAERNAIFRITGELAEKFGMDPGDVQAVLWFWEKKTYGEQGTKIQLGTNSSGARQLLAAEGVPAGDDGEGGLGAAERPEMGGGQTPRLAQGDETVSTGAPLPAGASPREVWDEMSLEEKRPYHEKFARGFEAYLFEGRAPSGEMRGIFQRFAAWMKSVYRDLTALNVELTDEVRAVMDRLVTTPEQIRTAQGTLGIAQAFAAKPPTMTDDEWDAYQRLGLEATTAAVDELQTRLVRDLRFFERIKARALRDLKREVAEQRKAVRAEVAAEVNAEPVNQARAFLKRGVDAEGNALEGAGKLDATAVAELYADTPTELQDWKSLGFGRYGMLASEGGLNPDDVAERFGYGSGQALVEDLLNGEKANEKIEGLTDQRMLERYGDITTPEGLERTAVEAVHNEAMGRLLATEYNILTKAVGGKKMLGDEARSLAEQVVGRLMVKDLKPERYVAAERRAARAAEEALKANDLTAAAAHKRAQIINFHAAQAVRKAAKEVQKGQALFSRIVKARNEAVSRSRDRRLVDATRAILAAYGVDLARNSVPEAMELIRSYSPDVYALVEPTLIAATANAKPILQVTVDDFTALVDTVRQLWTLSRQSKLMTIEGRAVSIDAARQAVLDQLSQNPPSRLPTGVGEAPSKGARFLRALSGLRASLRRVESWVQLIDGGSAGAWRTYVWQPISEASDAYRTQRNDVLRRLVDLVSAVGPTLRRGKIDARELGYTFGGGNGGVGKAELLHALLHSGNESNKRKLLLGRQWATEDRDGNLDTSRWDAFLARAHREGTLTKADWDFCQSIWDLLNELKPAAQKAHFEMFGRYFSEVTADEVSTPFGSYRGGYVPALTDDWMVGDRQLQNEEDLLRNSDATMFPAPTKGFTMKRAEDYTKPLALDLGILARHVDQVLRFAHLSVPTRDVLRLLRAPSVSEALQAVDPTAMTDLLMPWLNRSAKQITETPTKGVGGKAVDDFFRVVRARTGMALMVGNVINALQQTTGVFVSAVRVKPRYLRAALWTYLRDPKGAAAAAADLSEFMASRTTQAAYEARAQLDELLLDPTRYEKLSDWAERHAYFLQTETQGLVDVITWQGAYAQAVDEGQSEAEAVRFANGVVRQTQGSFAPEDISRAETGSPLTRALMQFYSYFNGQSNLLGTEFAQAARDRDGMRAAWVYATGLMLPAVGAELIKTILAGDWDDDEDNAFLTNLLDLFFGSQARYVAGLVPVAGAFVMSGIERLFTGQTRDDRVGASPAASTISSAVGTPAAWYRVVTKDGQGLGDAVRDTLSLVTLSFGGFAGATAAIARRPAGYLADVAEGKVQPTGPLDFARGLVTGRASPASKQ